MAKAPRFIIRVSDGDQLETAWTHYEAWLRSLQLYRPGVTVTCVDTDPPRQLDEPQLLTEHKQEEIAPRGAST